MIDDWKLGLLSPFLRNGVVDPRLQRALGISPDTRYEGHFEKVLDRDENTTFDFYMEAESGRKIFFDLKLSETGFGSCVDGERHRQELERHYRPHLREHVDGKWLEPATFFANYGVLSKLSYLDRYGDSGLVLIFSRANKQLTDAETAIKQIVSKVKG